MGISFLEIFSRKKEEEKKASALGSVGRRGVSFAAIRIYTYSSKTKLSSKYCNSSLLIRDLVGSIHEKEARNLLTLPL